MSRKSATKLKSPLRESSSEADFSVRDVQLGASPKCPQVDRLFLYLKSQFLTAQPEDYSTVLFVVKCVSQGWYSVTTDMGP